MHLQKAFTLVCPDFHYSFKSSYPEIYDAWVLLRNHIFGINEKGYGGCKDCLCVMEECNAIRDSDLCKENKENI